jgi:VanZ family protein
LKINIRKIWLIVGIAIIAFLWLVSLMPAPPYIGMPNEDKYAHLISYGGTMWWWAQLWPPWKKRLLLAVLLALMGVAIEFAQGATSWRSFDVMDMLANSIGVLVGWVVAMTPLGKLLEVIEKWQRARKEPA